MSLNWSIFDSALEEAKTMTPNNFDMFQRAWYSMQQYPVAFARRGVEDLILVMRDVNAQEDSIVYRFGHHKGLEIYVCQIPKETVLVFPFQDNTIMTFPLKYMKEVLFSGPACDEGFYAGINSDRREIERLTNSISECSFLGRPDNSHLN